MVGSRVLISGMGSELGSRVASLLEDQSWVGSLVGIDTDPPRRRLQRTRFHRIVSGQHERIVDVVTDFNPHIVVHIAVWEPFSRAAPDTARRLTADAATSILGAAAECRALESIVIRSGIEVYGRRRGTVTRPSEQTHPDPTSRYGRTLERIEETAFGIGDRIGIPVGALRLATVLGPHVPSPLGRILRLPAVPFSALADPPFAVIHQTDAAEAFVRAAERRLAQPVNIVAPGAITMSQAIRRGRKFPIPVIGPEWLIARRITYALGAPVPDHIQELIHRGRLADNSLARELLDFTPSITTGDAIDEMFDWPSVIRTPARKAIA